MTDLSQVSTGDLAEALAARQDLFNEKGFLNLPVVYRLRAKLGAIACVDSIPIRSDRGKIEGGLIRRNTGHAAGKLWYVGGSINYAESIEDAVRRHYQTDLGLRISFPDLLGWTYPITARQYRPADAGGGVPAYFGMDPTKHSVALMYLVRIIDEERMEFGITQHGGQEVSELLWFSSENAPKEEDFAYGCMAEETFKYCLSQVYDWF